MNVRHQENFTVDENGNNRWETVMLGKLNGCWKVYQALEAHVGGFHNCSTMNFTLGEMKQVLDELRDDLKELKEDREEEKETVGMRELQGNIKELQGLVDKLSKDYDDTEPFEVHVWY